jgi:hypothetical protein
MIHRAFTIDPGYDCRVECKHDSKGQHGICPDTWICVVVDNDARAALEIRIHAPFYPETVIPEDLSGFLRTFWGRNLALHFGYPTSPQQVLDGPESTKCSYIGTCYSSDSWGLRVDELMAHFDQRIGLTNREHTALRDQPAFYTALEEKLAALVAERQAERLSDGDLKWRKCDHCDGRGVVDVHRAPGLADGKVR